VLRPARAEYPDFFVCAEAYWDTEWRLQQLGFDACYDKLLYDRLVSADVHGIRAHLNAALDYQNKLIRFLENHDERRASLLLGKVQQRAAAVILFSVPGLRLVFDGQLEGARRHLPVRLGRAPEENPDEELRAFYQRLIPLAYRDGEWAQASVTGWPDNPTSQNLLSWTWRTEDYIWWVIVNYAPTPSQGMVQTSSVPARPLRLVDALQNIEYSRDGAQIARQGLFVSLDPWEFHYFRVVPSH
jgi:glycosidase